MGQKRKGGMPVLAYATGQKHRQRDHSGSKKRHEHQMRARFGDYAYQGGNKDHKRRIVAYPGAHINIACKEPYHNHCTQSPEEDI